MFEKEELDSIENDEKFKQELKESRKELMSYKKKNNGNRKRKAGIKREVFKNVEVQVLPRNMMANWNIKLSQYYLEPLYKLMLKEIKSDCDLIHCDETKLQCNKEQGRKAHSNSYMWVIASGEQEKKKGMYLHMHKAEVHKQQKSY